MDEVDYRVDVIKSAEGEDCLVPSGAWKRELMTPNLDAVKGPLNITVWRYMRFEHFSRLLRTQKLYFPRVDLLGDPLEGSFSQAGDWTSNPIYADLSDSQQEQIKQSWIKVRQETMQRLFFVSCWHMNEHESEMHWSRYGSRNEEAVAIATRIGALCTLQPEPVNISGIEFIPKTFAGEVNYIDYGTPGTVPETELSLLYKANHFKGDGEFRSIIHLWSFGWSQHDRDDLPSGVEVSIAPGAFVDCVIPAPNTAGLKEKVKSVLDETGFKIPLQDSSLERTAHW